MTIWTGNNCYRETLSSWQPQLENLIPIKEGLWPHISSLGRKKKFLRKIFRELNNKLFIAALKISVYVSGREKWAKVNSFNSNYFKLEMFLYERPSLQRAISLHMSTTNQPEWTLIIWQKSFLGEKVKVNNLPIFDLTKYSFVVRSK